MISLFFAIFVLFFSHFIFDSYALPQPEQKESKANSNATISGKLTWLKHDLSNATIQVFKDANLKKLYATGVLFSETGEYEMWVEPGAYYVVGYVDDNKNGVFDTGDGIGVYGVLQWDDPKQKNKPINVQRGEKVKDVDIRISARILEKGKSKQMIPIRSDGDPSELSFELARISNGLSGKVIFTDNRYEDTSLFAYTDLNWKTRIGQVKVDPDGSYKLYLSPGKYYLLAVVDENLSDFFDPGDKFGVYGLSDLSRKDEFPKPVLVEKGKIVENINIPIIGMQDAQGKVVSIIGENRESEINSSLNFSAKISGKVSWDGHEVAGGIVQVYEDLSLSRVVGRTVIGQNGNFDLRLMPGSYYFIANIDSDKNGKYNSGDGFGGYGSDDISIQSPVKAEILSGDNPQIEIAITATYDDSGSIQPINPAQSKDKNISTGISGKVYWDGRQIEDFFLLVSKDLLFERADTYQLKPDKDGYYMLEMEGENAYYLMAVVDSSEDGKVAQGDGVGVYGTNAPMVNLPQSVFVFEGRITQHVDIYIRAIFTDDNGNTSQIPNANRFEIQRQYGKPEDIYHNTEFGRQVEEWWYWSRGISFKFETDGVGWLLKDTDKFTPSQKAVDLFKQIKSSRPETDGIGHMGGLIYYSFDQVMWAMSPSGLAFPLALGGYPTVSSDGSRVLFLDIDGNLRLIEAEVGDLNGKVIVKRSEEASAPVISPDGKYIAFIQKFDTSSKICIKHIATQEKRIIPTPDVNPESVNWLSNGQMLVYSASDKSSKETGRGKSRRIYTYDLVDDQIDPITNVDADDSEPIWSPTDPNTFAYARRSGGLSQIWTVTIPKDGKAVETQVTKYGAKSPTWLSDGSGIVYENNAQLWVVKPGMPDTEERAILVDDKPVFGQTPFAR